MTTTANIRLLEAARNGNLGEVKAALEEGADIHTHESNDESYTALHLAAMNGHNLVVKVLIDRGADVHKTSNDFHGRLPLHLAAKFGKTTVVKTLLSRGSKIDALTATNETIVHKAAVAGDDELMELVLAQGGNPFIQDSLGDIPLHIAAQNGDADSGEVLLDKMASQPQAINTFNKAGFTPLHLACIYSRSEFVDLLLQQPSIQLSLPSGNDFKNTPLHEAVTRSGDNAAHIIKKLIAKGADKSAKNAEGKTPAEIALDENKALLA
eukprot:TRINITY_DN3233_c0_g1_i1.p1 TRINITY_DN3233_c0_g1~~TRINITY_DN3233_c0_g1_i1.p1  ORF type:complete len:267 (+),score=77.77 TRINITY_DN3233_c0_g1_i1:123-923(+)